MLEFVGIGFIITLLRHFHLIISSVYYHFITTCVNVAMILTRRMTVSQLNMSCTVAPANDLLKISSSTD